MSGEDQQLLARIGQLAGQINRHRNQQAGGTQPVAAPSHPHTRSSYRGSSYRHASAPYPTHRGARGYRGGRGAPATTHLHRNRTLHLNASTPASGSSTPGASPDLPQSAATPTWVSKNDRHRQLINANVYEKQTQSRAKAIEETRQRKLKSQRHLEKKRFADFLQQQGQVQQTQQQIQQQNHASVVVNANPSAKNGPREIEVNGVRFQVMDGGKKLVKAADDRNSVHMTPKTATIAGIVFHRTKTGNLVAARVLQDHRQSGTVKKINEPCKIFSTTGSCPKGRGCRYLHDPDKVALCKDFLKDGKCAKGGSCDLSHEPTPERVPNCLHFARGNCTKPDCAYSHSNAGPGSPVCRAFGFCGYCERGATCTERHVFECPDFSNTGVCKTRGCKLPHRERASLLRSQMRGRGRVLGQEGQEGQEGTEGDEEMADVSSDEGMADSDDVDSDEVAEFIEADSDESDIEDGQNFIAL